MKQLVIFALIIYILSKLGSFLFRLGGSSQQNRNFQQRKPGNINVDSKPKNERRGSIKGGDYIDYEEVK